MTYFQQSAKISSRQNFRPYGIIENYPLWDYGHVNVPQRSNTNMAVGIQRENVAADFRVVLLFASTLKPIRHEPLFLKGQYRGNRRSLDSEERRE